MILFSVRMSYIWCAAANTFAFLPKYNSVSSWESDLFSKAADLWPKTTVSELCPQLRTEQYTLFGQVILFLMWRRLWVR